MKSNTLFFALFLLCFNIQIQAQENAYSHFFGSEVLQEKGIASLQLEDGSILLLGNMAATATEYGSITLSKLSPQGDLRWTKNYGTANDNYANNMTWMEDGHIAIAAESHLVGGEGADGLVLKVDIEGNVIWQKMYGLPERTESFYAIDQTTENGLIVIGFATGSGFGNDHYVAKLDGEGNVEWEKLYGTENNEVGVAIRQIPDGNYVLIGDKQQGIGGAYGIEVLQLDEAGEEGWRLDINDFDNGGCKNMILDSNGDLVISGEAFPTKAEAFDALLAKVTTDGTLLWQKFIDGTEKGDAGFDLMEVGTGGGYLVVGYGYNPERQQTDILLSQVDMDGEKIETRYFGGEAFDIAYDIIPTLEGGFLVTGFGFEGGSSQYFLAHDFPLMVNIEENNLAQTKLNIFPNPIVAEEFLQTTTSNGGIVEFWDAQGRLLEVKKYASLEEIKLPDSLRKGVCFLKLMVGKELYWRKVVVH